MHARAEQLIRDLGLQPHPEGGHYAEVHRSAASTSIYFLLASGELSRWHRVTSEEIWHFYEGSPLELLQLTPGGTELERIVLGPASDRERPVHCVPGGYWQAARSRGAFTLVAAPSRRRSSSPISHCSKTRRRWRPPSAATTPPWRSSCSL
jgi:predicted cupin superfamily sugar epimerase